MAFKVDAWFGGDFLHSCNCAIYGLGIIILLGAYGLLQERIMSVPYEHDFFTVSTFLVLLTRMVPIFVSLAGIIAKGEHLKPQAPFWQYFVVALSNVGSTTCSFEALKSISFPMQMIGKSFKMIPVMIWSRLLTGKTYSLMDWVIALVVTGGVAQFCLTGSISAPQTDGSHVTIGLLILCAYVLFDGFTPTFQERIFNNNQASAYNMMLYTNISSCIVCSGILFATGGLSTGLKFCMDHPLFLLHAALISTVAMLSQLCIYPMIQEYGALAFAVTMNMRQVVSIIASYMLYAKPLAIPQVFGLTIVFGALYYKTHSCLQEAGEKCVDLSERQPFLSKQKPQDGQLQEEA